MLPYRVLSDEEYRRRKEEQARPNIAARARQQNSVIPTYSNPTHNSSIYEEDNNDNEVKFEIDDDLPFAKLDKGDIRAGNTSFPYMDDTTQTKPKRGRPKKKDTEDIIYADSDRKLSATESNVPYEEKYKETNNVLKGAIFQLDQGIEEINADINYIRSSKTLKRKYDYLGVLQGTKGSYINTKITAARELNNTITKCNELELKRVKELHLADKVDDDKAILDTYNAFINTPVGTNYSALGPTTTQMTINDSGSIIPATIASSNVDMGYQNYLNNPTSIQHMMQLESNPNVQQVVVYNQATGAKSFEIMDMSTGEVLQNVEKNDVMFLEDTTIDVRNRIAKNINLNETYPLIIVGSKNFDEY